MSYRVGDTVVYPHHGAGKVLKLDRDDRVLGSVEMEVPGLIALHPSRDLMFVARSMSAVMPTSRGLTDSSSLNTTTR